MERARLLLLLALLSIPPIVLPTAGAETVDQKEIDKAVKQGLATISAGRAKRHVWYLAGMKCEGRASGESGCDVAAGYIAGCFKEHGVEPGGRDGSYFQKFPIRTGPFPGQRGRGQQPRNSTTSNVIGFVPVALSASEIETLGLGRKKGAVEVGEVLAGKPAEAGGVLTGDLVLGLGGKFLGDDDAQSELDQLADGLPRGRKCVLLLRREGKKKLVTLEIP